MAKLFDRVKFETSSTGTGTITVGNTADGYQSPVNAGARIGYNVRYVIETSNNDWEIGVGRFVIDYDTDSDFDPVSETSNYVNGIAYSSDGSKMYVQDNSALYQYSLSTAYDPSTASYDSKSLSTGSAGSVFFKPDGTKVFVTFASAMDIKAYDLSTAWDISTAGSVINQGGGSSSSYTVISAEWNSNGTKLFVSVYASHNSSIPTKILQFNASTAYDHTTTSIGFGGSEDATLEIESDYDEIDGAGKFSWNADGSRLYVMDAANKKVHVLATSNYSLNSPTYLYEAIDLGALSSVRGIHVEDDDNILIIGWHASTNPVIKKYDTSTAVSYSLERDLTDSSTNSLLNLSGTSDVFFTASEKDLLTTDGIDLDRTAKMKFGDNLEIDYEGTLYPQLVNRQTSTSFRAKQGFIFSNEDNSITYAYIGTGSNDGATLFYNDGAKLATIATGIDIYGSDIVFEGTTSDAYETTVTVVDPTADQTVTIPDQTGTVMLWQSVWPDDPASSIKDNIPIGEDALNSVTTGFQNIAIGRYALSAETTGYNNTGVGHQSLKDVTTGHSNTAVGMDAGLQITTGVYNTLFGRAAGRLTTTGSNNTAVGVEAMVDQGTDSNSTAVGYGAGRGSNLTGGTYVGSYAGNYASDSKDYQVAIGYNSMNDCDADYSVAVGSNSMTDGTHYRSVGVGYGTMSRSTTYYPYYNVALGYAALDGIYSGDHNVNIGYYSDTLENGRNYGVAVGSYARTTSSSVCVGYNTMGSSSYSSYYTIAIGYEAAYDLDGGDYNTFVGFRAGFGGGTGNYNVGMGYNALYDLTSGANNTAIGGYSGGDITTGNYNTMLGHEAGRYVTTGDENTYVGFQSGRGNGSVSTGSFNIAVGSKCLWNMDSGLHNVAVGWQSGWSVTSGSYNTLMGYKAGHLLTTSNENTFIGYQAGYGGVQTTTINSTAVGLSALVSHTSSDNCTAIGYRALASNTTGDNNTAIGYDAGYDNGSGTTNATTTGANNTFLGYQAVASSATASNEIVLGNSSVATLRCNVSTISSLSDERDKTAIEDLPYGLDFINDMRPVKFTWNRRDGSYGAKPDVGFIAQELREVEMDHGSGSRTRLVNDNNPNKLEADYVRSYPILVKAVQELSAKCDALEARLAQLEGA